MNNILSKRYIIKIPKDIIVLYSKKKKIVIIYGPLQTRSLKLKIQIFINHRLKTIIISPLLFVQTSNKVKKYTKVLQNTFAVLIKYMIIESSMLIYKKLKIIGVGYRMNFTENFKNSVITFKLGYSHYIYIRTFKDVSVYYIFKTKLCLFGNSYENVSQFSAKIRSYREPEPYKSKGIVYDNENIKTKKGKKV